MSQIIAKRELAPKIFEFLLDAPRLAKKARAGQFVIVMADGSGERIPLTIADYDRTKGTITLVLFVVGSSSWKLSQMEPGQNLHALLGPLGRPSEVEDVGTVVMVAGGVGVAPIFPIAREFREAGCRVISIQGARSKDLLFWQDRLASVSDEHYVCTDDGSFGTKALVTEPLRQVLEKDASRSIARVYAIGPTPMMRACSAATQPFGVETIVSLNTIMVDGTGMCGGCRVEVGGDTRFTCVDGPEFDGHLVNWDLLMLRQGVYRQHENCSFDRYVRACTT